MHLRTVLLQMLWWWPWCILCTSGYSCIGMPYVQSLGSCSIVLVMADVQRCWLCQILPQHGRTPWPGAFVHWCLWSGTPPLTHRPLHFPFCWAMWSWQQWFYSPCWRLLQLLLWSCLIYLAQLLSWHCQLWLGRGCCRALGLLCQLLLLWLS